MFIFKIIINYNCKNCSDLQFEFFGFLLIIFSGWFKLYLHFITISSNVFGTFSCDTNEKFNSGERTNPYKSSSSPKIKTFHCTCRISMLFISSSSFFESLIRALSNMNSLRSFACFSILALFHSASSCRIFSIASARIFASYRLIIV